MKGISVIVPVYNGASTIESCIESAITAGKRVSEIIIVDDGSKDDTLSVAEKLSEKYPVVKVIHTDNHGSYAARRTGILAAAAPYIAFLDADDHYINGSLDKLADLLEHNNADVAMGSYIEVTDLEAQIIDNDDPEVISFTSDQMWPRIMKWKTQEFVNYVWNKIYKRELFIDLIEEDGINQGDDVLIITQAFMRVKRVVETSDPVYLYYRNPKSLTRVGFGDSDLNLIRVWDKIVEIMMQRRPDLLSMAKFNRWRTDFTLITRLILVNDRNADRKYADELRKWRKSLNVHWRDLISPHAMPKNREFLIIGLRFCYTPTKVLMRIGRRLMQKDTNVILHSGEKI